MISFEEFALSITKENMNSPYKDGFGLTSRAQKVITCFQEHHNPLTIHHVLSLRPDLSLYRWKGFCLFSNSNKLKIILSYGYVFPMVVEDVLESGMRLFTGDGLAIRMLFEHGTLCPDEKYHLDYPWVFEIYNDVQQRRAACARACVALAGVSRRVRSQRDVLSIVMRLVWGTRTRDEWLF